jgi:hypothetical protein
VSFVPDKFRGKSAGKRFFAKVKRNCSAIRSIARELKIILSRVLRKLKNVFDEIWSRKEIPAYHRPFQFQHSLVSRFKRCSQILISHNTTQNKLIFTFSRQAASNSPNMKLCRHNACDSTFEANSFRKSLFADTPSSGLVCLKSNFIGCDTAVAATIPS